MGSNIPQLHEYEDANDSLNEKLSEREQLFLMEFLKDFKPVQAAERSGLSKKMQKTDVYSFIRKPHFQNALRIALNEIKIQHQTEIMRIIKFLNDVVALDPLDFIESMNTMPTVGESGSIIPGGVNFKNLQDIPKELRQLIQGIRNTRDGINVIFIDKIKAAELLGKYYGYYSDDTIVNNTVIMNQTQVYNKIVINHRPTGQSLVSD